MANYLNIDNVATQDDLYKALVDAVEPILAAEKDKRIAALEAYSQSISAAKEIYEQKTTVAREGAEAALTPLTTQFKADCEKVMAQAKKKIEALEKVFQTRKKMLEERYDADTVDEQAEFEEFAAPFKEQLEAQLKEYAAEAEAAIEPINEEYKQLAAAMDAAGTAQ